MSSVAVPPFLWSQGGDFDSPVEYTVPGSGEVQPYTATATFSNNSGQAILPALRIKSAAGNLLALVFPAGQIADGDSSEVTFVPPFGSAASDTEGIRFNTDNEGGYLKVTANDFDPGGFVGITLVDESGAGIDIDSAAGGTLTLHTGNGGDLQLIASGTATLFALCNLFNVIATSNVQLQSSAGVVLKSVHTGGGLNAVEAQTYAGDPFAHKDLTSGNLTFQTSTNGVWAFLAAGKQFIVYDHLGHAIFVVNEDGSLQGKTGKALTFNL